GGGGATGMSAAAAGGVDSGRVAARATMATAWASKRRADRATGVVMSLTFRKAMQRLRGGNAAASPCVHEAGAGESAQVAPGLLRNRRAEFSLRATGQGGQIAAIEADRKSGREHEVAGESHQAGDAGGILPVKRGPVAGDREVGAGRQIWRDQRGGRRPA